MERDDFKGKMQEYFRDIRAKLTDIALGDLEAERGYWQLIKDIDEAERYFNGGYEPSIETEGALPEAHLEAGKEKPRKGQLLRELKEEMKKGKSEAEALDIIGGRHSLESYQRGGVISQLRISEKRETRRHEKRLYGESEVVDKLGVDGDALKILSDSLGLKAGEGVYHASAVDRIAKFSPPSSDFKGTEAYSGKQIIRGLGLSKEDLMLLSRQGIIHKLGKKGNTTYYAAGSLNGLIGRDRKDERDDPELRRRIEAGEMVGITQAVLELREAFKGTKFFQRDLDEYERVLIKHAEEGFIKLYPSDGDRFTSKEEFYNFLRVEVGECKFREMSKQGKKRISPNEASEILGVKTYVINDLVNAGYIKKDDLTNHISVKSLLKYLANHPDLTE